MGKDEIDVRGLVLHGSLKHDGKVYESGTLATKLPKAVREPAFNAGVLLPPNDGSTLKDLQAENDKLRAMVAELGGDPEEESSDEDTESETEPEG